MPVRVVESVSAAYTDGGFRLEPGSEPADYLGAELEYLILLAEARDERSAALHDRFIAEHFAVWVPQPRRRRNVRRPCRFTGQLPACSPPRAPEEATTQRGASPRRR